MLRPRSDCFRLRARTMLAFAAAIFGVAGAVAPVAAEEGEVAPAVETKTQREHSWYAATIAEDEKGNFLMVHFWAKGALFRSEAVLAGRRIVTIVAGKTYYIIDAVGRSGVAIERSEAAIEQDGGRLRPFANELQQLLLDGGELVGSEKAKGRDVEVYRVTDNRGRRTIWVTTTTPAVPIRIETYDRASGTSGRVDYVNWLYGPPLRAEFFEPDPRIELEKVTYEQYRRRMGREAIGPAPVLYRHLLHGGD